MTKFKGDATLVTLAEARLWLGQRIRKKGADCPCCDRYAKAYNRKLNAGMAVSLIRLYRLGPPGDWVHLTKRLLEERKNAVAQEYSKLRFWSLAESYEGADKTKRSSGYWRITDTGVQFVLGQVRVPRKVVVYGNQLVSWSSEATTIKEALGDKFDYDELMSG